MDPAHVARTLRAALEAHSRLPGVEIRDDATLDGRIGLDSFALVEALTDVEDQLGVTLDPARLAEVRGMTFARLAQLLAETAA